MLAYKSVYASYPSGSSPSFHSSTLSCPRDLSLVLDEFQDVIQDPTKGFHF